MDDTNHNDRPGLAMIANCAVPYRFHQNRLIAEGIQELKLHTLLTHGPADFQWNSKPSPLIHVSYFGSGSDSPLASTFHSPFHEWRKGGRLIAYLKENNIRAVICHGYRYISYLRTIDFCHKAKIPVFVMNDSNIRGDIPGSLLRQFLKIRVYSWWLNRVAGVMPMGEYGDQFFVKYGSDRQRHYHVPYTPDYDQFARVDMAQLDGFRRRYGLCGSRRYLIYSGRLVPVKRVDLLIDAFAQIASRCPDWDLLIAGDGVLKDKLARRVRADLRRRVIWTGFLEQEQLVAAYHASSVLVLPSDQEPWAVVVQEAMAAGLIVVASDVVGASRELVVDKISGRIFPAGNRERLAEALLDVTSADRIEDYREQSELALSNWRSKVDPVGEVRRALSAAGVL